MSWYGTHPVFTKADVLASGAAPPRACRMTIYRVRCGYQVSGACTNCSRDQATRLTIWRAKYRGQRGRFTLNTLSGGVAWVPAPDASLAERRADLT